MRHIKSFLVLSLITLVSLPAFALDDTQLGNVVKLRGVGSKQGEPTRVLKLVRFVSNDANVTGVVSGDAVCYSVISDDGVSVIKTATSADGSFAGISAMSISTADATSTTAYDDTGRRNWGWIIVHGPANANLTAGGANGATVGDLFLTSADEGSVTTLLLRNSGDATTSEVRKVVTGAGGFFLDTPAASATTVEVFVENV